MSNVIRIVNDIKEYERVLHRKIASGEDFYETGIIMTPEIFSKVFSPERIKLLQRIHCNNVKNIYQLAKELGKPYEVVFRNIKYFEGMGLIRIITKNKKKIPETIKEISIDMFPMETVIG